MKKMVIVFVIGFVASWQLKGNMSLTSDNHVHVMSWAFPVPAVVQSTQYYAVVSSMIATPAPAASQATAYAPRTAAGVAAPPPLPIVNTAGSAYDGNASSDAPAGNRGQFNSAAKAIGGR